MKFRITHTAISVTLSLIFNTLTASAQSASDVIEKFINEFEKATSLTMRYTINTDDSEPISGIMCIRGEKFKINSAPIAVWYDGTTQWTYTADTKEVSVTEPTPEELADINPFAIINNFRHGCESRIADSNATSNTIVLTPLNQESGVRQATVVFSKTTSLPQHLTIELRSGSKMTLDITSATTGINYPSSTFVFNKDKYPGSTVIDLR